MGEAFLVANGPPGNVVLDLDGVIFLGGTTIAGTGRALRQVADAGIRVVFATNNGTRTATDIADRIARDTGFETDPERIVTSALAATAELRTADQPVYLVGESGLTATLLAAGLRVTVDAREAKAVIVALDRSIDYAALEQASTAIRDGARFIATNTDVTFPTPGGPVPGAGAIVAAVAAAAGRSPEVAGKPNPPMIREITARLGPGKTWVVGDRPETDLALAHAGGWVPVLVLTGITHHPDEVPRDLRPQLVFPSVAELGALLSQTIGG